MKNYLKYSIMITLTLLMTIGLAQALPIGITTQASPFESLPSARVKTTPPAESAYLSMFDGDTDTSGYFYCSGTTGTTASYAFYGFATSAAPDPIGWVSIQMKYTVALYTDDQWRWEYSTDDGATWTALTAFTSNKFDSDGVAQFQSFSQLAEPTDGTWTWDDIATLRVRVYLTRGGTGWDGSSLKVFRIYEVWTSIYAPPTPPVSSPTMSLQPVSIAPTFAGDFFFVEVYCNDVTALAGWQYELYYDPNVLMYLDGWAYYPWTDPVYDIGTDYVGLAGTIPVTNPLYLTGLTGNFAVARIYFMINDDGTGLPVEPNFSWLRLTKSFIGDPEAGKTPHHVYHGYYGTPPVNSYLVGNAPLFQYENPITTEWVEEYPEPGNIWHLTSWEENEPNGILDPSDQVDMTPIVPPSPDPVWFHVDQIWECNADPNTYVYMILTRKPTVPEFPLGIGILLGLAPAIPLIYLWRRHPKRRVNNQ